MESSNKPIHVAFSTIDEYVSFMTEKANSFSDDSYKEIERKWIASKSILAYLRQQIKYKLREHLTVLTGYMSINPEIRYVSKKNKKTDKIEYRLDYKSDGTIARKEVMLNIDFQSTLKIASLIRSIVAKNNPLKFPPFIESDYYSYMIDDSHCLEVKILDNDQKNVVLEIEFSSEEEALKYQLPNDIMKYVLADVTYDPYYKMKNYWDRTRLHPISKRKRK